MKLIKPSYEIIPQSEGLEGVYRQIEIAGRTCYKSESKGDDPKKFVDRMAKSFHGAMLEHGTVYLKIMPTYNYIKYISNDYSRVFYGDNHYHVTTNLRVVNEHDWLYDLEYLCEPTEYHEKRYTVRFITDRATANQFVRHRAFSFAQESQRYVNYSKGKFGEEVKFVLPCWMDESYIGRRFDKNTTIEPVRNETYVFIKSMIEAENSYIDLLAYGWKPEEARVVLPNATATELVMTGFESDWKHFFDLRAKGTTGRPHPQAKELAEPLMKELYE